MPSALSLSEEELDILLSALTDYIDGYQDMLTNVRALTYDTQRDFRARLKSSLALRAKLRQQAAGAGAGCPIPALAHGGSR